MVHLKKFTNFNNFFNWSHIEMVYKNSTVVETNLQLRSVRKSFKQRRLTRIHKKRLKSLRYQNLCLCSTSARQENREGVFQRESLLMAVDRTDRWDTVAELIVWQPILPSIITFSQSESARWSVGISKESAN